MISSDLKGKVSAPFQGYTWIWALMNNREVFMNPNYWLPILQVLYHHEGVPINPQSLLSQPFIEELRALQENFGGKPSLTQSDRTFLRGYQHYWTAVGTLWPTSMVGSTIRLTPLGKAVASKTISQLSQFADIVVARFELPNLATYAPDKWHQWREHDLRIKPLQLLLQILLSLHSKRGVYASYLIDSEVAGIVVPLAPRLDADAIANEILAFREGGSSAYTLFPTEHFEIHSMRNVREFLQFLATFGYCIRSERKLPILYNDAGTLNRREAIVEAYFLDTLSADKRGEREDSAQRRGTIRNLTSSLEYFPLREFPNDDEEVREFVNYIGRFDEAIELPEPAPRVEMKPKEAWAVSYDLLVAMCSKPFVILTGPSGTGKSRKTINIARALDYDLTVDYEKSRSVPANTLAFVSVGANWSDDKHLLGFKNPFGEERTGRDGKSTNLTYEVTNTLKLLLRASHPDNAKYPHFLLLDEMNLSHVERYFSTFLSVLEADRSTGMSGSFELISQSDLSLIGDVLVETNPLEADAAVILANQGRGLSLPPNLYIVGTVNVDETTYMFSPKVLDRAYVVELEAMKPKDYLSGTSIPEEMIYAPKALSIIQKNIERRRTGVWETALPKELIRNSAAELSLPATLVDVIEDDIQKVLAGLFTLLEPVGSVFGFRAINEVFAYIATWLEAEHLKSEEPANVQDTWHKALDSAVLQKLLPKIHGSKKQLGGSLDALSAFLDGKDQKDGAKYSLRMVADVSIGENDKLGFQLHESKKKIDRMRRTLETTLYTSYI